MEPHTDTDPKAWRGILQRASALRRQYHYLPDVPQSTWSLVGRAAMRFGDGAEPAAKSADHTYGLWVRAMRSVLNDLYRKDRVRGPMGVVELNSAMGRVVEAKRENPNMFRVLERALEDLAFEEPEGSRKADVVALRYFENLTWPQIAEALGISKGKARREWDFARAWLRRKLTKQGIDV